MIEGIFKDTTGVVSRDALALVGNPGGLDELLVPNPESQIQIINVCGVNPPF